MLKKTIIKKMKKQFNQLSQDIYKKYGLRFDLQMNDWVYYKNTETYIYYIFIDFCTMKHSYGMAMFFKSKRYKKWRFDDDFYESLDNFIKKCYKLKEE